MERFFCCLYVDLWFVAKIQVYQLITHPIYFEQEIKTVLKRENINEWSKEVKIEWDLKRTTNTVLNLIILSRLQNK